MGAGVAIPAGIGASRPNEDVPAALAAIFTGPLAGMAGYWIGHAMDAPAPEFVIRTVDSRNP